MLYPLKFLQLPLQAERVAKRKGASKQLSRAAIAFSIFSAAAAAAMEAEAEAEAASSFFCTFCPDSCVLRL